MLDKPASYWWIMRNGKFNFYWFPGVTPGIYRMYYDGWHLTFNLWIFSFGWSEG